ncbi:MAG: hypothetical protein IT258_17435, partial [Saprospiraceae bacterium]|nr:hypothetical protein [Saprospiraceae bacterium]
MISVSVNKPLNSFSIFTIVGLLLLSPKAWAQQHLTIEWERTYGGEGFEEMAAALPTVDGGYIFGGVTTTRPPSFEITSNTIDTV